ncbi:MAG: hypothetical protein ACE37K_11885 [Planctomycetota bacterium]
MLGGEPRDSEVTHPGWNRSNWLAEKILSGELPAAKNEVLRRCDRVFAEDGDLDEHVHELAAVLGGADACSTSRLAEVRAYLERLLHVREMWASERT